MSAVSASRQLKALLVEGFKEAELKELVRYDDLLKDAISGVEWGKSLDHVSMDLVEFARRRGLESYLASRVSELRPFLLRKSQDVSVAIGQRDRKERLILSRSLLVALLASALYIYGLLAERRDAVAAQAILDMIKIRAGDVDQKAVSDAKGLLKELHDSRVRWWRQSEPVWGVQKCDAFMPDLEKKFGL